MTLARQVASQFPSLPSGAFGPKISRFGFGTSLSAIRSHVVQDQMLCRLSLSLSALTETARPELCEPCLQKPMGTVSVMRARPLSV